MNQVIPHPDDPYPVSFEDIWYAMDVRKRAVFFENVIKKTELSVERLNARFTELLRLEPAWLSRRLIGSSMLMFRNYTKVLSASRATAVGDRILSLVGNDAQTATTMEMETEVVPLEAHDEPTSKTGSYEPGTSRTQCESDILSFPPPSDDARKSADSQLCQLVHCLPSELFDKVLQNFLHMVFRPRKIYVGVEHLNLHVFGALNRTMYAKYRGMFLSESVWVLGQGNEEETIGFLFMMPISLWTSIKKVEVKFTRHDYTDPTLERFLTPPRGTAPTTGDGLDSLIDYIGESAKAKSQLMRIWLAKLDFVVSLKLDELVLDFGDAYGPDGEFVGRRFANAANSFSAHTPAKITILGTDDR